MKKLIILILGVLSFTACKKETPAPAPATTSTTTATTTTTVTAFNGFFPLEQYNQWSNGVNVSSPVLYNTKFTLFTNAVTENQQFIGTSSNVGSITVNSRQLQYYSPLKMYMDTTSGTNYSLQRLITLNSSILPSFTVTLQDTFPVYTSANATQINDTLFRNINFTVPLTNISYYDEIECSISPSPANGTQILYKKFTSLVNQITFTPSELSTYTIGQQLYCRLTLKKISTQVIGGKNFKFEVNSFNDFYMIAQ